MKKNLRYLDESKWMFENNDDLLPTDNLPTF